jgi:hypothetical protein|tara:strand:- start:959 stop:1093 length:135 start_codon:yes stop_codon:yes gene_type:complete
MKLEDFDSKIKTRLIELVNGIYTDSDLINELQSIIVEYEIEQEK